MAQTLGSSWTSEPTSGHHLSVASDRYRVSAQPSSDGMQDLGGLSDERAYQPLRTMIDADAYVALEGRFSVVFEPLKSRLGSEAAANVVQYMAVAELEMACESFVLSLAEESVAISEDTWEELMLICKALDLDKASVFKADFWEFASASELRRA